MTEKLWGGRFTKTTDQLVEAFNASIQFDQRLYREDIRGSMAHARMLGKVGILTAEEVEAIVYSGTKINIDYFLDEVMDSERVDEIFDYFSTAETDKVSAALDELGENDFSETEVRLVRIKFLSEMGN